MRMGAGCEVVGLVDGGVWIPAWRLWSMCVVPGAGLVPQGVALGWYVLPFQGSRSPRHGTVPNPTADPPVSA
jgi:hypothetical protein